MDGLGGVVLGVLQEDVACGEALGKHFDLNGVFAVYGHLVQRLDGRAVDHESGDGVAVLGRCVKVDHRAVVVVARADVGRDGCGVAHDFHFHLFRLEDGVQVEVVVGRDADGIFRAQHFQVFLGGSCSRGLAEAARLVDVVVVTVGTPVGEVVAVGRDGGKADGVADGEVA